MICVLVACAIIAGTAQKCDLTKPPELVPLPPVLAATWQECQQAARDLRAVTPANLRIVRFEFYTPEKHTQEAKRK